MFSFEKRNEGHITKVLGKNKSPSFTVVGICGETVLDTVLKLKENEEICDAIARAEIEGIPWDTGYTNFN